MDSLDTKSRCVNHLYINRKDNIMDILIPALFSFVTITACEILIINIRETCYDTEE